MLVKSHKLFIGDQGDVIPVEARVSKEAVSSLLSSFSVSGVKLLPKEEGSFLCTNYIFPIKGSVVKNSSGKRFGKVSCFGKSHYFKLVSGELNDAIKQVRAIIDEVFAGDVVSTFEFKDGSYVSAVSMGSGQPVYSRFILSGKPSSQAGVFLKRVEAMPVDKRTSYIDKKVEGSDKSFEVVSSKRSPSMFRVYATKMSRVVHHLDKAAMGEGTVGIFTSFQAPRKGSTIDHTKNEKNYRELGNILKNLLSGPIPMDGVWQGEAEKSYMVPDIPLEMLKALNNRYNQAAFIYAGPETSGSFQLWGSPSPGSGPEDYQIIDTWNNYAVSGLKEPQGYTRLPDTPHKFSYYEGGDTPQEYLKAVDDLNSFVNKGIEQVKVQFPEAKREPRVREKHEKLKEQVAASKELPPDPFARPTVVPSYYKVWFLESDPDLKSKPVVLFDKISRKDWQQYIRDNVLMFVPEETPTSLVSGHYSDTEGNVYLIGYPDQEHPFGVDSSSQEGIYYVSATKSGNPEKMEFGWGRGFYLNPHKEEALEISENAVPVRLKLNSPYDANKGIPEGIEGTQVHSEWVNKFRNKEEVLEEEILDPRDFWEQYDRYASEVLQELGYDGIVNVDIGSSPTWAFVFNLDSLVVQANLKHLPYYNRGKRKQNPGGNMETKSMYASVGYWISPVGAVVECHTSHIAEIIRKPENFGYTTERIDELYEKHNEPKGHEGHAREEIMRDLIGKGWIRIRWVPKRYAFVVQIARMSKKVMDNLQKWAMQLVQSGSMPNADVSILPIDSGVDQSFHSLKDIAADVLFTTYAKEVSMSFKVVFENGDYLFTKLSPGKTLEDAKDYYIGKEFTFGTGDKTDPEREVKAVDVFSVGDIKASSSVPQQAIDAYKEAVIWTNEEMWKRDDPEASFDFSDFSPGALQTIQEDLGKFYSENSEDIEMFKKEHGVDDSQVAHSFWLTREGHGAGFIDFDSEYADRLSEASGVFGEADAYVGDDGQIYFMR